MKSNQKFKLDNKAEGNTALVGGIVALLIVIIVGVMIYFEFTEAVDSFDEVVKTFTGYSHGDNASAVSVTVDNSPDGTGNTNVTCYSSSAGTLSYPTFTLNGKIVSMAAGAASNFTQINVTYTSVIASAEAEATDMASSVFSLLPLIALVVVASVILAVVVGFGGSGKKGGL
jgi:hypothetical protein